MRASPRRAAVSRSLFRPVGERHRCPHRVRRRPHHLPDHGLHRVRQPANPRQCGHGQGRGIRRHLPGGGAFDPDHGALCQLSDRTRARHGAQCLLRLHAGADLQIHLAAGARLRLSVRRARADHHRHQAARIRDHLHPAKPEARGLGRSRAVSRHHRAADVGHRRRPSGDAGDARRSEEVAGDPRPGGVRDHRGPQLSQDPGRHPDRHPDRHRSSAFRSGW